MLISRPKPQGGDMGFIIRPWQIFLLCLSGWMNRHQQQMIEYLITENQILKEKLGKKRILLDDDQRRRLAVKGKILGRKLLLEITTVVTPDTILRWHRQLVLRNGTIVIDEKRGRDDRQCPKK